MQIVILVSCAVAAVAVLAGVVLVVVGRGGEVVRFEADYPPVDLPAERPITASDLSALRLPLSLWGYHVRAVDEVLDRMSASVRDRDRRIAVLEEQAVLRGAESPSSGHAWGEAAAEAAPPPDPPEEPPPSAPANP